MPPAVSQGAIGVCARAGDESALQWLRRTGPCRDARRDHGRARAVATHRRRLPGAAGCAGDTRRRTAASARQRVRAGWLRVHGLPRIRRRWRTPWPWACASRMQLLARGAGASSPSSARRMQCGAAVNRPAALAVVVTRDEAADGPLSRELRALGLQVLGWPVLSIGPAADARALERRCAA